MSCSSETFHVGDKVVIQATFTDPGDNNALVDPTTVRYQIKNPNGVTTTYLYGTDSEVTRTSVGLYVGKFAVTLPGTWYWRTYSSGNFQGANEGSFEVEASEF